MIEAVAKAKPSSVKGTYMQSCTLSATMSPPVRVDVREFHGDRLILNFTRYHACRKTNLSAKEYLTRLNASPFFIVVDYQGLKVGPMTELRKRLNKAGAEMHVVKNSIFRIAAKEAGVGGS